LQAPHTAPSTALWSSLTLPRC